MNRRDFIKHMGLAGTAPLFAGSARAGEPNRPLKIGVFADLHFTPGVYTNDTPEFLEKILARAEKAQCDMVIHLGDMVQNVADKSVQALLERYNSFKIPSYHVIGNHEQDGTTHEETLAALHLARGYYAFDRGGFRFIILDPNYFCNEPGRFIHHSKGNYFQRAVVSTINWIPPEQVAWLRATLDETPNPCVILSHQSLERRAGIMNGAEVRAIFADANKRHPGKIRLVINGHYHADNFRILDNVAYWDVNSANMYYFGVRHRAYPPEYLAKHAGATYTLGNCCEVLGWKDPLSAILTLYPNGRITIEGSHSEWLYGVSPQMAYLTDAHDYDGAGREIGPFIRSLDLTINAG